MAQGSHPTRVRGLKRCSIDAGQHIRRSHPTRVRGLKLARLVEVQRHEESHPTRVRGLKHRPGAHRCLAPRVAPHAGAWIETLAGRAGPDSQRLSHPTRVRGLKQVHGQTPQLGTAVAPHAGAWIETRPRHVPEPQWACRTPHGCVIEIGRLERSCKPACHDAPLRIHDLKLPAKEYPKAGLKQKSPHGDFRKGFLLFPGAGEGT